MFYATHLLLFSVASLIISTTAARCPDCGSTAVPYPLSTGPKCGDQSYKVRCDNGALKFDTLNNTYSIISISPESNSFVIRPASFLNRNTCVTTDVFTFGVELDPSLPFNITARNTIFYLNCSESLLTSPLNCSSSNLCYVYLKNSANASAACGTTPFCCTSRMGETTDYIIRIRQGGCTAYTSFVNLDSSTPVNTWPEPGLEIQWGSPPEPSCRAHADCDAGSSTCLADAAGVKRCLCSKGYNWDPQSGFCSKVLKCFPGDCRNPKRTALVASITCLSAITFIVTIIGILLRKRYQRNREARERLAREREEILNASGGGKYAKVFSGREIKKATNNFAKNGLLGAGGFGEVYKGVLDDGTLVAVKCAKLGNTKGTDQVLNEVRILCQVNHKSLVQLLGCCVELEQPMLVYEYASSGTLLEHLKGQMSRTLTWIQRLHIARDTSEGLSYLHFSASPPIYHRDVKSSNILLDENMKAKVADFGLSRLAHTDLTHITTCAQGTLGYLDPEYYKNYHLTDKSDVYSFGVVLLELLTSEKAIDFNRAIDDVNLASYVRRMVEEERLVDVVDPKLKEGANNLELETMKALGLLAICCIEESRQNRPSMKEVTEEIEYIINIFTSKGQN